MDSMQIAGYKTIVGNNIFKYVNIPHDKGLIPDKDIFGKTQPRDVYREKYAKKDYDNVAHGKVKKCGVKMDDETWKLENTRSHQYGYRANKKIIDQPWFPVSNVKLDKKDKTEEVSGEYFNITASTFANGLAMPAQNLGRDLGHEKVLLRDQHLIYTKTNKYEGQTINEPGGRVGGHEGIRIKL